MSPPPLASTADHTPLDPKLRQAVLRMIPYGVHVLACREGQQVCASVVDWVMQASFEPPMLAVALRRDGFPLTLVRAARRFALHPLGEAQQDFARHFFKFKASTPNQINGQPYTLSDNGLPILDDAPAAIEAEVTDELDRGDHVLVLARVMAVSQKYPARPLLLRDTGWNYGG